jgi:hypothetical protein
VAVDEDQSVEAVVDQAARHVVHQVQEGAAAQGDRAAPAARFVHVLRRVARPDRRGVQHADHLGHALGDLHCSDRVGVDGQMRPVLLKAGHRDQDQILDLEIFLHIGEAQVAQIPGEKLGAEASSPWVRWGNSL